MICTKPSITKLPASQHQENNTMKITNTNPLKGILIGALLALRLSSSAYAAVSLEDALDTAGSLSWTTTNALNWSGQTAVTHDGVDAAASPAFTTTNNNSSAMFQTFVTGPGTVSYWWKVSSETNNDRLTFSINGAVQAQISGDVDWQARSFAVPAGSQLLRFVYQKNASISAGLDRAWVDQVQFSGPALVANCAPNKTVPCGSAWGFDPPGGITGCGSNVSVQVFNTTTNNFTGPCSYQATRTWLIVDSCTNQTTCVQTVTITDTNSAPCTYALSLSNATFGAASATGIVSVTTATGCSWNVSETNTWISILSGASGSGSGAVVYQVAANPNTSARTGNLLIANRPFIVTQSGSGTGTNSPPTNCNITITPSGRTHSAAAQSANVSVYVAEGCEWGIVNSNTWISFIPSIGGVSNSVRYTMTSNTSMSSRSGALVIGGQPFVVTQLGATNVPCTYSVSPMSLTNAYGATSNSITLTTAANCPWSVINTNPWLSIPLTSGSGSAPISYFVAANGSTSPRSGYVSIASKLVFIRQNGAGSTNSGTNCIITLSPYSRTHEFTSSTGTVSVSTSSNCPWSVVETNPWINIASSGSGLGNGTVIYTVTANSGGTTRSGHITIGGQTFVVTQTGTPPILSSTPVDIPPIEVTTIGHLSSSSNSVPGSTNGTQSGYFVHNYLIDQGHVSDGGGVLPDVSVNWDTNTQFTITVTAPAGKKFAVEVPPGSRVGFAGFLWWESTRGGFSPGGTAAVHFENLEGTAPEFSGATPVLSDSHGFFGFMDLEGTTVTNRFAFTSLRLTGSVTAKFTGNGTENYTPHLGSSMHLYCSTPGTDDPGQFVFIVPASPLPLIQMMGVSSTSGVDLTVYGTPGRTHVVECSPDTVTWREIASGVIPSSGSMQVRDATTTPHTGGRFYRTVERSNTNPTSTQ
jgi:hypothetical protein